MPRKKRRSPKASKAVVTAAVVGGSLLFLGAATGFYLPTVIYEKGIPRPMVLLGIGNGHFMQPQAAIAFMRMRSAAKRAGIPLRPYSSYRSFAKQLALYARYELLGGAPVAKPGHSNHNAGLALDIDVGMTMQDLKEGRETPTFRWLARNAGSFGFRRTVAVEPWHHDYLGNQ